MQTRVWCRYLGKITAKGRFSKLYKILSQPASHKHRVRETKGPERGTSRPLAGNTRLDNKNTYNKVYNIRLVEEKIDRMNEDYVVDLGIDGNTI